MQTKLLTLGTIDAATIKRIVIVRRNGGTRTMKGKQDAANMAKFIREHADVELEQYSDRLSSVQSGADYRSIVVNVVES